MKPKPENEGRERQDWVIVLAILLIGFCCVLSAGQWALRFSPSWMLDANMESNLDPNSGFSNRPITFFEPIDAAILTQPAWVNVFLTPGAAATAAARGTPFPASTQSVPTTKLTTTPLPTSTLAVAGTNTAVPTNTLIWYPPAATATKRGGSPNTPTNTSPPPVPSIDLSVTQVDGTSSYTAGGTVTYTVTISNAGPSAMTGAVVTANIPAPIVASWTWVCTFPGVNGCDGAASNSANFTDTVNLPSGASIVYTVTAVIANPASGNLTNVVSVSVPAGYTDTNPANNSSTDTNTASVIPSADLQITMVDGTAIYIPGGTLTYTIVVTNSGPSNVTGATVTDNFPLQVSLPTTTWICGSITGGSCTASGSGNINDTVNLPAGSSITYTVTVTINPGASGSLVNTASVGIPAGYTETNSSNNSVTDTNTFSGSVNLQVTLNEVPPTTTYIPGSTLIYQIVVSNAGPSSVTGAAVTSTFPFPGQITGMSWTCTITPGASCTASGAGNINDTVNLPVGRSVTYTVNVNIGAGASGNLFTSASVSAPTGYTESAPADNTDTDTNTASPTANLQITKTDNTSTYIPGGTVSYQIVVSNPGPSNVTGATVTDNFPAAQISSFGAGGGCAAAGGATCGTWGGSGNINDTINLPVGSSITYTVNVNISAAASGNLINTASVSLPVGYAGPPSVSATDTDTASPTANLQISKSDGVLTYTPGGTLTYQIIVSNPGPSNVTGATVTDNFSAQISGFGAGGGCAAAGGATCGTWGGSGNINDTVNLPVGSSITYTVPVNVSAGATGNLVNTASVSLPVGYAGPPSVSATDTDAPSGPLTANLWITKTDNATDYVAGGSTTYYVTVGNSGPSAVTGVRVQDTLPGQISPTATWTCTGALGASCTASGSGSVIDDSAVNLPVGSSVTYRIVAPILGGVSGNLVNTAYASLPVGFAGTSPVQATDTDTQIVTQPVPGNIQIGLPDGNPQELNPGDVITLAVTVVANGDAGPDLVCYELENTTFPPFVLLDWVRIQISDGHNWFTVYDWGNGSSDTNTNVAGFSPENDEFQIFSGPPLYNDTGIAINVDAIVSAGTYPYIRIISSPYGPGNDGGLTDIDAIQVLP